MLSIKPATFSCLLTLSVLFTATASGLLHSTTVSADISPVMPPGGYNEYYRQEPIFPLPREVSVNQNKAALGESLFFDTRLSRNNQVACISCHKLDAGGDDGMKLGMSSSADHHVVNTPSIFNAQFNFRQNWNGSVRSLHDQIDRSISSSHAFNNAWDNIIAQLTEDVKLRDEFHSIYSDGITSKNIIDAIVEFEKTLITPNSPFDRYLRNEEGSLTEVEIEGYQTFKELGCISCHQGINIGGNLFQKFGVFYDYFSERGDIQYSDYGLMNITYRQMDEFVFKVPSLRNVAVTAPYLHDGSAATLEEAIIIMGKTQLGRTLSAEEVTLIEAFLRTLTGEYKNRPLDTPSWETPAQGSQS